ncbi:MAG: hypothetical protein AAFZ07_28370 [Actinomycetota bacterium]
MAGRQYEFRSLEPEKRNGVGWRCAIERRRTDRLTVRGWRRVEWAYGLRKSWARTNANHRIEQLKDRARREGHSAPYHGQAARSVHIKKSSLISKPSLPHRAAAKWLARKAKDATTTQERTWVVGPDGARTTTTTTRRTGRREGTTRTHVS